MKVKIKTGVKMRFFLIAFLLMHTVSTKLSACAGTWQEMYLENEYYNFTDPNMIDLPEENPLYKLSGSYAAHDTRFKYFAQKKKEANIKAWHDYFNGKFDLKEIEALFYNENSIEKSAKTYLNVILYPNFSKYIHFLHLQNHLAQNKEEKNQKKIITKGLKLFNNEQQPFLKERYLYLLMRLYHHTQQYSKVLEIYKNNKSAIDNKGIVKEWIEALRAGAYQHLGKRTKANQLYAQIFATHTTNPHYGYYDFKVSNDQEWQELLKSTENKKKKALYHFLRAMQWKNEPLHELKSIAKLAPKSIWFERLAYMILQDLQYQRYDIMVHSGKKDKYFKAKIKSYKLQKKYFLSVISHLKEPTFFTLYAKLYLNVLEYNALKRNELLILRSLANNKQKPYAKLLTYIYSLHQLSSNSSQAQRSLYLQLKPLLKNFSTKKQTSILRYTALQISTLNEQNTIEKALNKLFAQNINHRTNILIALNYADASKFETYIEKKKRSYFETTIFKQSMKNLKKKDVAKILSTLYLQENNLDKAQHYLRQIPELNLFTPYNPFNASINGTNRSKSKTSYSQKKFIETILRIQSVLTKDPHSARDHFLYANALYNKSWFGNFPMSSVLYRSTNLSKDELLPKTMNLDEAKKSYELALKYAEKEEFRAEIAYQLLKIKFNQALTNRDNYSNEIFSMPHFGSTYNGTENIIKLLKASKEFTESINNFKFDYEHTNYGQKVIKECITFEYF